MFPRRLYQKLWLPFYRFYALRYVQQNRRWRSHGIQLEVPVGVFHPGIYFSTPILLDFLQNIDLEGKKVLDIGTGSGALAIFSATKGGLITAVDIHPDAVQVAQKNALLNQVKMTVLQSDLFGNLPVNATFDYVLANPPYYPKDPQSSAEQAFFAGAGLSYFSRFFVEIQPFLKPKSIIWMILSEDCDWSFIRTEAQCAGFKVSVEVERWHWGERLFVAAFRPATPPERNTP